jgi:hypothetical protein
MTSEAEKQHTHGVKVPVTIITVRFYFNFIFFIDMMMIFVSTKLKKGFLGSGKSTLLQHLLNSKDHKKRLAVINNEVIIQCFFLNNRNEYLQFN